MRLQFESQFPDPLGSSRGLLYSRGASADILGADKPFPENLRGLEGLEDRTMSASQGGLKLGL